MLTKDSIDAFAAHLTMNGMSHNTVRAYRADLMGVQPSFIGAPPASHRDVEIRFADWLNYHRNTLAPKTIERKLGCFRSWGKFVGIPHLLPNYRPPKPAPPEPHPIPEGIDGVLAMIESTKNPRHKALCVLTGLMGLRVDEAIRVRHEHFDLDNMELVIMGKGSKQRRIPVGATAWRHLRRAHALAVRTGDTLTRINNPGARYAIKRHGRNAGLSREISSHDMRATFATAAYDNTKDLRAVQEILGHADSKTTQRYTGVSAAARRAAAEVA